MFIILNGYPGVGKLTIGRILADKLNGRLLDIHSVYNVAFALTEFRSADFYYAINTDEDLTDDMINRLSKDVPLVFTTVLTEQAMRGADADMARFVRRAEGRGPLRMVHLSCALDENKRRIQSQARDGMRKPRDPDMARRNQEPAKPLTGLAARHLLKLDTTGLSAQASAQRIADWSDGL